MSGPPLTTLTMYKHMFSSILESIPQSVQAGQVSYTKLQLHPENLYLLLKSSWLPTALVNAF